MLLVRGGEPRLDELLRFVVDPPDGPRPHVVPSPLHLLGQLVGRPRLQAQQAEHGPLDPPGFAPTHQPIDLHRIELYTLAGDRLERLELFIDTLELGRQIGAVPPEGSPGDRFGVLLQRLNAWRSRRQTS